MSIHKTAVVEEGAIIAANAEIGPFAVIGSQVTIGSGTKVGPHVVIDGQTTIGENCQIFSGASIGQPPQSISYKGESSQVKIGNNVTLREYVTIHRGSAGGITILGDDCYLMNYAHVAHDCLVGKGVIMANSATLAGHVVVGDGTVMGGICVFHQFVRIGKLCMVSGMTGTRVDIPPFVVIDGLPATIRGLNIIGMKRNKFSPQTRTAIKAAYKLLYRSGLNFSQAIDQLEQDEVIPEVKEIIDFFRSSKRGVLGSYYAKDIADSQLDDKPMQAQQAVNV